MNYENISAIEGISLDSAAYEASEILREPFLAEKIVFVDGQSGCGKTMFSPIVAALDRAELLTFAYELEHICTLYFFHKITYDAAMTLIRMMTDLRLYNVMMSRETNFRITDQSSVFRDINPWRYFLRLMQKGDEAIPERIRRQRPILNLTTHNLVAFSEPIFAALKERAVFLEIVRHPLYTVKQQSLNMERLIGDVRDFIIYFQYKDTPLPFYAYGWEELFLQSNSIEKAVYAIEKMTRLTEKQKKLLLEKYQAKIITIPFEKFVIDPWPYMKAIEEAVETKMTKNTFKMLKKQHVPRARYAEGIGLKIYKHCGWEPPGRGTTEIEEFQMRRQFIKERASTKALEVLDQVSREYEEKYLGKKIGYHLG